MRPMTAEEMLESEHCAFSVDKAPRHFTLANLHAIMLSQEIYDHMYWETHLVLDQNLEQSYPESSVPLKQHKTYST